MYDFDLVSKWYSILDKADRCQHSQLSVTESRGSTLSSVCTARTVHLTQQLKEVGIT